MNKVLITGANGYLGSSIFEYFKKNGIDTTALIRKDSSTDRLPDLDSPEVLYVEDVITKIDASLDFQVIIHCATLYNAERKISVAEANIGFPMYVINRLLGEGGFFINIDTSLDPETNFYSRTKDYFNRFLREFSNYFQFQSINVELEYFFDENEPKDRFLPSLIRACVKDEDFDLTEGNQVRDFIYMQDVCHAILSILHNLNRFQAAYQAFEVGSGKGIKIKDLAKLIKQLSSSSSTLHFGTIPYRENETMRSEADTTEIKSLGWEPDHNLESGLKKVIKYIQNKYEN